MPTYNRFWKNLFQVRPIYGFSSSFFFSQGIHAWTCILLHIQHGSHDFSFCSLDLSGNSGRLAYLPGMASGKTTNLMIIILLQVNLYFPIDGLWACKFSLPITYIHSHMCTHWQKTVPPLEYVMVIFMIIYAQCMFLKVNGHVLIQNCVYVGDGGPGESISELALSPRGLHWTSRTS